MRAERGKQMPATDLTNHVVNTGLSAPKTRTNVKKSASNVEAMRNSCANNNGENLEKARGAKLYKSEAVPGAAPTIKGARTQKLMSK